MNRFALGPWGVTLLDCMFFHLQIRKLMLFYASRLSCAQSHVRRLAGYWLGALALLGMAFPHLVGWLGLVHLVVARFQEHESGSYWAA